MCRRGCQIDSCENASPYLLTNNDKPGVMCTVISREANGIIQRSSNINGLITCLFNGFTNILSYCFAHQLLHHLLQQELEFITCLINCFSLVLFTMLLHHLLHYLLHHLPKHLVCSSTCLIHCLFSCYLTGACWILWHDCTNIDCFLTCAINIACMLCYM